LNLNKTRFFVVSLGLFAAASATALDFGLVINQEMKTSNEVSASPNRDLLFSYRPVVRPWLSAPLGQAFSLYLSGSIGFDYAGDFRDYAAWRNPPALPELDRAELAWLASPSLHVRLGRQRFQDPAGLVAAGLFDGLSAGFSAAGSRFSLGAWYTGFLYKDTADIVMTRRDREDYEQPFAQDYFASRRALVSLEWEKPDLGPHSSLALGLLGQFDLNGDTNRLHSQYLSARYGLRLPQGFDFRAEAAFGLGESPEWTVFFAGGLGLNWTPPGPPDDRLSLGGRYSSPFHNRRLRPFTPLSCAGLRFDSRPWLT
jgi:hypothetical protein